MYELTEWRRVLPSKGKPAYELKPAPKKAFNSLFGDMGVAPKNDLIIVASSERTETYNPLAICPKLHRRFIEPIHTNQPAEEWALGFVSKYGHLGLSHLKVENYAERVSSILEQRERLRDFYKGVVFANANLEKIARLSGRRLKKDDYGINAGMLERFNEWVAPSLTAKLKLYDAKEKFNPRLMVFPKSLISWMWIRATEELIGRAIEKRCSECESTFWITESDSRRKTCSDRCRKRRARRIRKA